jgi:hypothetical protein
MARAKNDGSANAGPWQVKGVGHETREAVRRAARKAGMPIGEWVDRTLHRAATEELTGAASLPAKIEDTMRDVLGKLALIEERQRVPWWKRLRGE